MAAVKNTGTKPEIALRKELHRRGLRYRVNTKLYGKPDLVFPSAKVVCFVDGDRWHGNGWRVRGFASFEDEFRHSNSDFWKEKITRNMVRDANVTAQLQDEGWTVLRFWASMIEHDIQRVADDIETAVRTALGKCIE